MQFASLYAHGFARVAACTADVYIADPGRNAASVIDVSRRLSETGVAVAVFPELTLTGYALDDLFGQDVVLDAVHEGLAAVVEASADLLPVIIVGAPLRHQARLFNTAVVIHRGRILGVVPKVHLPNYREFYERRQFASGAGITNLEITVAGQRAPFGTDLLFAASDVRGLTIGVELCEDMFVPVPPSSGLALAGATVLANLSGSPITIGRAETRNVLCRTQSIRCLAAYLYAAAGQGESTTDLSWDGQTTIFENGRLLNQGARFEEDPQLTVADIDLDLLRQERARQGTFEDNRRGATPDARYRTIEFALDPPDGDLGLLRVVERFPFVPADPERLAQDCYEAYNIQVDGLAQRLRAISTDKVVIGVSGGLDSTHALIVAARAMDLLGLPRTNILGYTMPGFATGEVTKSNAWKLMEALGITAKELDIRPTARQMLEGLEHPFARGEEVYDVTFENVQAGLRTDYLFRLANHHRGIVLGTGDLSELALGWSTYGVGDQMSHYNVNAGVPKTLIQHLIRWVAVLDDFSDQVDDVLAGRFWALRSRPNSFRSKRGESPQSTEKSIGPYELQDFNLFYTLRFGFRPAKIAFLAQHAWSDVDAGTWPVGFPAERRRAYDLPAIRQWLIVFVRRFFGFAQFKRSAMPNGPKVSQMAYRRARAVTGGALSDGNAAVWLADIEKNVPTD